MTNSSDEAAQKIRQAEDLQVKMLTHLENALNMKVGLTEKDSIYDLAFIGSKVKLVSIYQERLSDILMEVTRTSIEVIRVSGALTKLKEDKSKEFKASEIYSSLPTNEKGFWLANQLKSHEEAAQAWSLLKQVVSQVKEAVVDRAGTIKRLDSDLRLHVKMFEAGVRGGATSPASYQGSSVEDVDID